MIGSKLILSLTAFSLTSIGVALDADEDNAVFGLDVSADTVAKAWVPEIASWNGSLAGILAFDRDILDTLYLIYASGNTNNMRDEKSLAAADSDTVVKILSGAFSDSVELVLKSIVSQMPKYEPDVLSIAQSTVDGIGQRAIFLSKSLGRIVDANHTAAVDTATSRLQTSFDTAWKALGGAPLKPVTKRILRR